MISFPRGTEMFQFSRLPSADLLFQSGDIPIFIGMSFLIRRSTDQSLFASSPKLIAGYYVLLRLLVPRHPPYTLIISSFSEPTNSPQNSYHSFDFIVYQDMCDIALTLFTCKSAKDQGLIDSGSDPHLSNSHLPHRKIKSHVIKITMACQP